MHRKVISAKVRVVLLFRYGVHHLANGNMLAEAEGTHLESLMAAVRSAIDLDSIVDSCELLSEVDQKMPRFAGSCSVAIR
jgi:hypothetical protein